MKVQLANISHCDEISSLFMAVDIDEYKCSDPSKISNSISNESIYMLIDSEGKCGGAVQIRIIYDSLEIECLSSQVDGGGTLLVEFCENLCNKKGIHKMWCWSGKEYDAIGFYEKKGFTEKMLMKKQFFGKDCWILGKEVLTE